MEPHAIFAVYFEVLLNTVEIPHEDPHYICVSYNQKHNQNVVNDGWIFAGRTILPFPTSLPNLILPLHSTNHKAIPFLVVIVFVNFPPKETLEYLFLRWKQTFSYTN